ncbi:MAG: rhodanese-like domain-containing protein [Bacteroidia bacterium]|nr:rhodanese-like domain-containing protein [Bacteroidia bacterium]
MGLLVGGFIWAQSTSRLTAQEAYKRWKENSKDIILLDVRTPQEYQSGHLRGAQNMDLYADFAKAIQRLPKDRVYFLYCASGRRSAQATEIMRQQGFEAYNIGGYTSAAQAGFPTE